ncbi:MAG TPA: glycerophosphodiester phosphodiesterase family protein [Actinomycetota bacterium]|nr:glycerophosphodiester phosphodiesterase family protein [Actinomycetota bacterium]
MGILRAILPLALALSVSAPAAATDSQIPVTVYAHRGGAAIGPENTMAAFEQAGALFAAAGVDGWLELDTQASADGTLVVIHDHTLDRTTDCAGTVIDWTYDASCNAAKRWPSFGHQPVPKLADLLARGRQATPAWGLMIEIKNIPYETNFDPAGMLVADSLVAMIDASGYPKDRIIVQSFWPPSLDRVELLDPELDTMLLTTSQLGFMVWQNALYATARGYEISAPEWQSADFRAETVAAAHALGRRVITWTVDSRAAGDALIAMGVDGIITNDPRIFL